jgi:predicted Zn-dependent protease
MEAKARGDTKQARAALESMLEKAPLSDAQRADLLQRIAALAQSDGDEVSARQLFENAEAADPGSLLSRLHYAEFLGDILGDKSAAIAKCEEVIRLTQENPSSHTEGDYSSDEYMARASELKARWT